MWNTAATGGKVSIEQAATVRLASVHATKASAHATELMYHAAGATSLYESSPIQRAFRDVHAVRQHMNVAERFLQDTGRVLLGLPPKEVIF
jgi:alkylation response protein AidB-like acyl-CoA dehydrogenase